MNMAILWFLNFQMLLVITVIFLAVAWLIWVWHRANLPPGPIGVPILGYLPNLGVSIYRTRMQPFRIFAQLSDKYGKVYSLYMGRKLVVMVSSCKAAREAFKNPRLNDRPMMNAFPQACLGVLCGSGKLWQYQRRFTLHQFRQFGIGKSSFQNKIAEETTFLLQEFHRNSDNPFDPAADLHNCLSNVLCSVVFGKRFDYSDDEFRRIITILEKQVETAGQGGLILFISILSHFQPKHIRQTSAQMRDFISNIVNNHMETYDNSKLRDYIDVYISELENGKNNNSSTEQLLISNTSLYQTVSQLFAAGTETTVTSLRWSLLLMAAYPEIQSRIQREIDSTVGRNRLPRLDDHLPLTEATIMEVQRYASIVPLGVPHEAAEDTTLLGYNIPKGALILCNIWAIHHDPEVWPNPEQFRPERFLDKDGKVYRPQQYVPFSIGSRKCLGEHLAKMELSVIFSHLLHQFAFKLPEGCDKVNLESSLGATNVPKPFQIVATKRE
ncbi:cytochrome P450 2U1-like [Amphiura filiformis]|uniref:cytochrome P450 2U1-like n=1 Tax=Amphiura filiformis TaxID=82378 RepID=UPI003B228032